jgi:carboxypeptidase C (cathepsin A)
MSLALTVTVTLAAVLVVSFFLFRSFSGALPTKHYAGFVQTDGVSDTNLYYYLVESASSPATDPLFVWMNGGPGASSLVGLFSENGPLLLVENNTLIEVGSSRSQVGSSVQ